MGIIETIFPDLSALHVAIGVVPEAGPHLQSDVGAASSTKKYGAPLVQNCPRPSVPQRDGRDQIFSCAEEPLCGTPGIYL